MPLIECHWCKGGLAPDGGACPYCNGQGRIMDTAPPKTAAEPPAERLHVRVTLFDQVQESYAERVVECSHYAIAHGVLMFFGATTDDMPFLAFASWELTEVVPPPKRKE